MNEHDDDLQVPAKFAEAMQRLQKERVFVPAHVDETISSAARKHLSQSKGKVLHFPRWMAAAASFVVLGVAVLFMSRTSEADYDARDINRDGQVDVLDAFELARRVEEGDGSSLDLNGDGAGDSRDVEILAKEAVRLGKGGAS